jgi:ABC-2 type transport system ATP-binding protein
VKRLTAAVAAAAILFVLPVTQGHAGKHSARDDVVVNPKDRTRIAITVFKPAGATSTSKVPVILHSHGWGGSRETEIAGDVKQFLDAGFGVISIDQRGHGESTGKANVQDPTKETEDIKEVIDYAAGLSWVRHNRNAAGRPIPNDPVLGAIGISYGGGYQTMTSLDEIADEGRTRFDAIAPEITWYDLPESLAPQKVPRTAWDLTLYASGADMLPRYVHKAHTWGAATGQWPDGTLYDEKVEGVPNIDKEFHEHSPVAFVERGHRIDVPALVRQGATDNLFNLNQGMKIFQKALTPAARDESYFVSFNGGHAFPNAFPPGSPQSLELGGGVDACSGDWTKLRIKFFREVFDDGHTGGLLPRQYNFTDIDSESCIRTNRFDTQSFNVDPLGTGHVLTTTGAGLPLYLEVAKGPMALTGVPKLAGKVTAAGLDSRAFFGLAVGSSPGDARVVQNNLMPLRQVIPGVDKRFQIELPGVAVRIRKGQKLYLTVSPKSDMYFAHGSRTPGGLALTNLELRVTQPRPPRTH